MTSIKEIQRRIDLKRQLIRITEEEIRELEGRVETVRLEQSGGGAEQWLSILPADSGETMTGLSGAIH